MIRVDDDENGSCVLLEPKHTEHGEYCLLLNIGSLKEDKTWRTTFKARWPSRECHGDNDTSSPMRAQGVRFLLELE